SILGVTLQQIQHFVGHTVRPGADGQTHDLGVLQSLVVKSREPGYGCVGVGCRLKVSQESVRPVAFLEDGDAPPDLLANAGARQPPIWTEAAVVAKNATARGYRAVHVGASKAAVHGHPEYSPAKAFAQESAQGVVTPVRAKSLREPTYGIYFINHGKFRPIPVHLNDSKARTPQTSR